MSASASTASCSLPAFTVFAAGDCTLTTTDDLGSLACGGNVKLTSYSIGQSLPSTGTCQNVLVSGGSTSFNSGVAVYGNSVSGGTSNCAAATFYNGCDCSTSTSGVVDFTAGVASMKALSARYAALSGTPGVVSYGSITLTAGPSASALGYAVFTLTSAQLSSCNSFTINAPAGVLVIVNVAGTQNMMQNFQFTLSGGVDVSHVLLNFPQTTALAIQSISVQGTVLAPYAALSFNNGNTHGGLFVDSVSGTGEVEYAAPLTPVCVAAPSGGARRLRGAR
ncbi:MAG: choice-of-anchor A family protein [Terracidiphilus sp.]|nr:choice-of-anchor A family protein [Terracidiphilus sp.]